MDIPFDIEKVQIIVYHSNSHQTLYYCEEYPNELSISGFDCLVPFGISKSCHDGYKHCIYGMIPTFAKNDEFENFRETYNQLHMRCKKHLYETIGNRSIVKKFRYSIEPSEDGYGIELGIDENTILKYFSGERANIEDLKEKRFTIYIKKIRIANIVVYRYFSRISLVIVEAEIN